MKLTGNARAHSQRDFRSAVAAIVGPSNLLTGEDDMRPYLNEWRDRYHGKALAVARPKSREEVAKILALANEMSVPIVPQGGNTGLVGGQIPFETGEELVVSLARMNAIVDVDAAGNTLVAEAGATLAQIRQAADRADRLFPLSLASQGTCQIGGNLATNAGGIQVLAYGTARELTLGIEVVLADGRIWNGLNRLRKNNTGYDLRDLFIGSEGTLGIITACALQLFPKPSEQITCMAAFDTLEQVAEFFARTRGRFGSQLTSFELMPRIAFEFLSRHAPQLRQPFPAAHLWQVLFELSVLEKSGAQRGACEDLVASQLEDGIISDGVIAQSLGQARELWRLRETLSEIQRHEGGSIKHDISVPIAQVPAFIERANRLLERLVPGCRPVPFGHFGDGNIHYNVTQPVGMEREEFLDQWERVAEAVHALALELGGSISAEHGIGRMKRDELARMKAGVEIDIMRAIKRSLDPKTILNPGKVL